MRQDSGGPAFPRTGYYPDTNDCSGESLRERIPSITEPEKGMSLRDYFAAKAMQGELITTFSDATPEAAQAFIKAARSAGHTIEEHLAFNAYRIADAMLAVRNAPTK